MKKKILITLIILVGIIAVVFISRYFKPEEGKKVEYPAPSIYYAMDNVHEVAVRPGGKELYAESMHTPIIVIVDIDSPDYKVLGEIKLPGGDLILMPDIVFSRNGKYAYVVRSHKEDYIKSWNLKDASYIVVIDCEERKVDHLITLPYALGPSLVPSQDGRWLYFTARSTPEGAFSGVGKFDLESQKVVGFLPLGTTMTYITLSNDGKFIYATQGEHPFGFNENSFKVIDAEKLRVTSSLEVGDGPRYVAVTPDGKKAYVSNTWSSNLSVINLETMEITATIEVGPEPREIAITPDGAKAYVGLPGVTEMMEGKPYYLAIGKSVAVVDTRQDVFLYPVEVDFEPQSIAMDPDGTRLYVSDGGCNGPIAPAEAHIVDTVNDKYLRPIILRGGSKYAPAGIDVSLDNSKLFVTSVTQFPDKGNLLVLDVATGKTLKKLDINARAVKVSASGKVYAFEPASATLEKNEARLFIIDPNSLKIIHSISLGRIGCTCVGPMPSYRIIFNKAEDVAYINYETFQKHREIPKWIDPDDTGLVAVDLRKGEVTKIFYSKELGTSFKGIALTPDEKELFVSDPDSKTVAIIDTTTNKEKARIPVGRSPSEIEIRNDKAYVLQQFNALVTIIDVNTHKVLKSIEFPGGGIHAQMDFELLDGRYLYALGFDSNFVLVYDLQEGKVVKVIDTGLDPLMVASTPDKHYLYVSEVTGDKISVIDTTTNDIVRRIDLASE